MPATGKVGAEIRRNLVLILVLVLLPVAVAGSEEGMSVVPAQEILDKIEKGLPVEYDHVITSTAVAGWRVTTPGAGGLHR